MRETRQQLLQLCHFTGFILLFIYFIDQTIPCSAKLLNLNLYLPLSFAILFTKPILLICKKILIQRLRK